MINGMSVLHTHTKYFDSSPILATQRVVSFSRFCVCACQKEKTPTLCCRACHTIGQRVCNVIRYSFFLFFVDLIQKVTKFFVYYPIVNRTYLGHHVFKSTSRERTQRVAILSRFTGQPKLCFFFTL